MTVMSAYFASINGVGGIVVQGGWGMGEASGNGLDTIASHPIVWSGLPTYGAAPLAPSNGNSMSLDGIDDRGQVASYGGWPGTADTWFYTPFLTSVDQVGVLIGLYDWADGGFQLWFDGDYFYMEGFGAQVRSDHRSVENWRGGVVRGLSINLDRNGDGQFYNGIAPSGPPVAIVGGAATPIGTAGPSATEPLDIGARSIVTLNAPLNFTGRIGHYYWGTGLLNDTHRATLDSILTTGALPGGGGGGAESAQAMIGGGFIP